MKALYAYFMKGVAPVDQPAPVTRLPFPFSVRASMLGWNLLFLDNRRYTPDPSKSEQINRGAYLANALAHCGSCHTPRNALMAEDAGRALGGGPSGRGTRRTSARIPSPASAAGRRTNWCSTCAPAASPARPRPVA